MAAKERSKKSSIKMTRNTIRLTWYSAVSAVHTVETATKETGVSIKKCKITFTRLQIPDVATQQNTTKQNTTKQNTTFLLVTHHHVPWRKHKKIQLA
jgi:hypothetical protein